MTPVWRIRVGRGERRRALDLIDQRACTVLSSLPWSKGSHVVQEMCGQGLVIRSDANSLRRFRAPGPVADMAPGEPRPFLIIWQPFGGQVILLNSSH